MSIIKEQLEYTLDKFELDKEIGEYYRGKVRDNYYFDDTMLMITTDRVSAFDHVLGTIPFKGQILTEIAKFWFDKTRNIVPNHIISKPDPQVLISKKAKPLPIEIIIRQYITGSLWREYSQGINNQYGFMLPDNLQKNQKLSKPIITPSTKAEYGQHDEPISRSKIIDSLVDKEVYEKAENISDTNYELLKQNVGENYRPIQNRNARKIFYNSGKQVSMEDTFKKDTVSSDRFLKCFQVDPVPTTPAVTTKSSLPDRRLSYRTVNRVSSFFMLIVMVFLLILAFYFTKFLYKKFYVQRVLRALVPSDLVARTPRWTAWKECSKTSAAVSLVEKGQKAAPGTPGAPGAPRTLGASGTPTTRTQAIPTATASTKPQIAPVAASTSTKPHIASAPAAVPARPAPVAPQRHVASAP